MKRRSTLVAGTAMALTLGSLQGACTMGNWRECEPHGPVCIGPTTLQACTTGEGSTHYVTTECEEEQKCVTSSSGFSQCQGALEGESCRTDVGCWHTLRCDEGICHGPTAADVARCETGPLVVVPDDGSEVVVDVPLTTSTDPDQTVGLRYCNPLPAGTVVAEGFLRVAVEGTGAVVQMFVDSPATNFPLGVASQGLECDSLYWPVASCELKNVNDYFGLSTAKCGKSASVLFYAPHVEAEGQPSVRVRLRVGEQLNSSCSSER